MFIVLHCGGIPFNGETIRERSLGGSESAAYYLAKHLASRGHRVSIFTKHQEEGVWDDVRYLYMGEQTEQYPMGDRYHFYCSQTPHDVNLAQRHPLAFQHRLASKMNLLWLHDIALRRNQPAITSTMWNVDGILTVSNFHKEQIMDSWELEPSVIFPITNGVDRSLYQIEGDLPECFAPEDDELILLYQSRPERGLENLVRKDGIMERLLKKRPDAKLYVCGYSHDVPELQGWYDEMYRRIEELPNCVNMGSLPKEQLARVQQQCHALVYPTEFEEVSCISMMEAMNAGLPVITSDWAALPETCRGAGVKLIKHKNGAVNIARFVSEITDLDVGSSKYQDMVSKQHAAASKFTWEITATQVECIIRDIFDKVQENKTSNIRDLIFHSDIIAAEIYCEHHAEYIEENIGKDPILARCVEEMDTCYDFSYSKEDFAEHYDEGTKRFYDGDFQWAGREVVSGTTRFECVASVIAACPSLAHVIDYGCAHGHFTIELAKRFPETQFTGIDISPRAIREAESWAEDDNVRNVTWFVGTIEEYLQQQAGQRVADGSTGKDAISLDWQAADAVIAAEVLEHVRDPYELIRELRQVMTEDGKMILTTPYGPWEQMSYQKDHPTRYHLHHFERQDLHDMVSHHDNFDIIACPQGANPGGQQVGCYVTSFNFKKDAPLTNPIDYDRKFATLYPRQTVSLCMIAKDSANTIRSALDPIAGYVDEVIVAIDETTEDRTRQVIKEFDEDNHLWPVVTTFPIESPLKTGFDEARNSSIEDAVGDWILWCDTDETVIEPQQITHLLRNNQFLGYPLPQTHFSIAPAEVLSTDYPVRLFRNRRGVKFYGVVHEHPETGLNEGTGKCFIQGAPIFSHNGYVTENVRRSRFDRNFPLMQIDRKKYPDRILGKFLWVRDVAHACQFHLEQSGGFVIPEMREAAHEAIQIWEELLETDQTRMIVDSMKYYSLLAEVLGADMTFAMRVGVTRLKGGVNLMNEKEVNCYFLSADHLKKFTHKIIEEKVKGYETKHF